LLAAQPLHQLLVLLLHGAYLLLQTVMLLQGLARIEAVGFGYPPHLLHLAAGLVHRLGCLLILLPLSGCCQRTQVLAVMNAVTGLVTIAGSIVGSVLSVQAVLGLQLVSGAHLASATGALPCSATPTMSLRHQPGHETKHDDDEKNWFALYGSLLGPRP
jgi:hypothetical protein